MDLKSNKLVLGLDFYSDKFKQKENPLIRFDYNYYTIGSFVMDNWKISDNLIWQLGFRTDYHNKYKYFFAANIYALQA